MYTLIRSLPLKRLAAEQVPALGLSFVTAELFYKFHSFTLECLAFLATWFVVDAALQWLLGLLAPGRAAASHRAQASDGVNARGQ